MTAVALSIVLVVAAVFFIRYLFPVLSGAPFLPTHRALIETLVRSRSWKGRTAVDIGCGDGRILIALAKAGAKSYGYEINPLLVWWARRKIKRERLQHMASVEWVNMWERNFSRFDTVIVFGIPHIMKRLEEKLQKELKPGAMVISNAFQFPSWPYAEKHPGGWYAYRKK